MAKKNPVTLDEAEASGQAKRLTNKELQQRLATLEDRLGAITGEGLVTANPGIRGAANSFESSVLKGAEKVGRFIADSYNPVPLTPAEQMQRTLEAYMHFKYGGEAGLRNYMTKYEGGNRMPLSGGNSMPSSRADAINADAGSRGVKFGKPAMSDDQFVLRETGKTLAGPKGWGDYRDPVYSEYMRFKYGMPLTGNIGPQETAAAVLGRGARSAVRGAGGIVGLAAGADDVARRAKIYESQGLTRQAAQGQAINDALENFLTAGFSDAGYDVNTFSEMNKGSRMRAYEDYLNRRGNVSFLDVPAALALQGTDVIQGMGTGLAEAVRNLPENVNYYLGDARNPETPAGSEFYRRGRAPGY